MAKSEYKRYRISVPVDDEVVVAWLAAQSNMSSSIRAIIKDTARRRGLGDVFLSKLPDGFAVQPRPVGRPRKVVLASAKPEGAVDSTPKAASSRRAEVAPAGGAGIVLDGDAMSDFGMGLSLGSFTSGDADGLDDIMDMMGRE